MKPFDERLADRVREVFDKHDEPVDPGAWEAMRSRLGKGKTRRLFPWLLRIAAALLLIITFSVLLMLPEREDITETSVSDTAFAEEDAAAPYQPPADHEALADTPSAPDPDSSAPGDHTDDETRHSLAEAPVTAPGKVPIPPLEHEPATPGNETGLLAETGAREYPEGEADEIVATLPGEHTILPPVVTLQDMADSLPVTPPVTDLHPLPVAALTDAGEEPLPEVPLYDLPPPEAAADRSLQWGVTAGPMLTYAEQQLASGIGFSAGASSEYRLSRKFAVTSGLLLAYQQFEVDNMPLRSRSFHKDYSTGPEETGYMAQQTFSNQSFEIMALDIPVNIQYQLMETTRRQIYIEAGFSSLLYLQQKITGEEIAFVEQTYYAPGDGSYRQLSSRVRSDVTASYGPFSQFDPARLLNLSFGYTISGGNNTTIIEPFIKYPLGNLGSRQIRMGMGGINLRIRFSD